MHQCILISCYHHKRNKFYFRLLHVVSFKAFNELYYVKFNMQIQFKAKDDYKQKKQEIIEAKTREIQGKMNIRGKQ